MGLVLTSLPHLRNKSMVKRKKKIMMMKRFKPFAFTSKSVVKLCDSAVRFGYLVFLGLTSAKLLLRKKKANRSSLIWAVM